MPESSGDRNAPYQPSNLSFLYQRHRSRLQAFHHLDLRPVPPPNNDSLSPDAYGGDKIHRLYPKEL
jgi:hypothetical protein